MILLYLIASVLLVLNAVLNVAAAVIARNRRKTARCGDCKYCRPIPENAGCFYNDKERHCRLGRGIDEAWRLAGPIPSIVTVDEYCNRFLEREDSENESAKT